MTDTLRDRIAESIQESSILQAFGVNPNWTGVLDVGAMADAILAMPGIAVVELPEPDDPAPSGEDERLRSPLAQWGGESGADFLASVWHLGEVQINQYVRHGWYEPTEPISPADARQFALALLAAAEYAEREQ